MGVILSKDKKKVTIDDFMLEPPSPLAMELKPPIEIADDGRKNAFTHYCSAAGARMHYATCQHILAGGQSMSHDRCFAALGWKQCNAHTMRQKETEAGHAMYYTPRERDESVRPVTIMPAVTVQAPVDTVMGIDLANGDDNIYAAAIEVAQQPPKQVQFQPGETPLQAARRALANTHKSGVNE